MREIKFRAWGGKKFIYPELWDNTMPSNWKQHYTLQQFTGLRDKIGAGDVCLFEGDILSLDGKIIGNIYEYEIKAHESESYIVVPKITSKAWIHSVQKIMDSGFGYTE